MPLTIPAATPTEVRGDSTFGTDPRDHNLLAMSFDPMLLNAGLALVTGTQYFMRMNVPRTVTFTNAVIYVFTVGATLTAGANNLALYDSAGTRLAATVDQTTNYTTAGLRTIPFSATTTVQGGAGVFVWLGFKSTGTTPVSLGRSNLPTALASLNMNLTAAQSRAFTNGSSTTALMPATITPASNTQNVNAFWVGLS